MRKIFNWRVISLYMMMLLILQITGCTAEKADPKVETVKKTEIKTSMKKTKDEIREFVYKTLNKREKDSIIDWKSAKVEKYKETSSHTIIGSKGFTNIKGEEIYRVTFLTDQDGILGPIIAYLNNDSYEILGFDVRL